MFFYIEIKENPFLVSLKRVFLKTRKKGEEVHDAGQGMYPLLPLPHDNKVSFFFF